MLLSYKYLEDGLWTVARGDAHVLHKIEHYTARHSGGRALWQRDLLRRVRRTRDLIVTTRGNGEERAMVLLPALSRVRPNRPGVQSLVLVSGPDDVRDVQEMFADRLGESRELRVVGLTPGSDARAEESAMARDPDIVIATPERLIDHIRRDNVDVTRVASCILVAADAASNLRQSAQYTADVRFIYAKMERQPHTTVFAGSDGGEEYTDLLRHPHVMPRLTPPSKIKHQEKANMGKLPFDKDSMKNRVKEIVRAIHEDEDPIELTQYKRFIKQHTSIFNRAYVAAYLLKYAGGGGGSRSGRGGRDTGARTEDPNKTSVFVSIGRSKRVHARDLVTLFTAVDGITREDIGQVKVLDNYSFVEVTSGQASTAIEKLNGTELRGRKLTVNFARRK
jgi:hypothetical protein